MNSKPSLFICRAKEYLAPSWNDSPLQTNLVSDGGLIVP